MLEKDNDPLTGFGTLLLVLEPIPSWPEALLPQQYAAPDATSPHTCSPPVVSDVNVKPPATALGAVLESCRRADRPYSSPNSTRPPRPSDHTSRTHPR